MLCIVASRFFIIPPCTWYKIILSTDTHTKITSAIAETQPAVRFHYIPSSDSLQIASFHSEPIFTSLGLHIFTYTFTELPVYTN